jgi:hypothetical protein
MRVILCCHEKELNVVVKWLMMMMVVVVVMVMSMG